MKQHLLMSLVLSLSGLFSLFVASTARADGPYHFLKEIPIGGPGGWDYLSVDEAGRRLYVSHATSVAVIDLDREIVVGEITNTPGVHGLAVAADLGRGFTSNGREDKAGIVDLKTLQTIARVDTGRNPDGMLFEPGRREVYMFNGRGESATVFEAMSGKVVATIPLGGKPEFATADPSSGRVFNNLEDKSEVAVIDTQSHQVVSHWPIAPGEEASGMAIDPAHHRLFLGCGNEKLVMMDSTNGQVLALVTIGKGVDACSFDPATQLAFASCGDGTVTIAREESPSRLVLVQTLKTEPRARTMTLDPRTHKIYLPSARFQNPPAGAAAQSGRPARPEVIPGSFKVLVYGLESVSAK